MQTIKTNVSVGDDRKLLIQLPEDVLAGEYEVVLVLNQRAAKDDVRHQQKTALSRARAALRESVALGYSIADELIEERRKEAEHE
ncbi:MAG: hypothetical protein WA984_03860 [Phormidesmis sp.]